MENKINLQPTECNLCGGKVIYTSNHIIYGKKYGSGYCYYCTCCGAFVGTHEPRPKEAYGILANREMREMKKKCHALFDKQWKNESTGKERHIKRQLAYKNLARKLNIPVEECHFGHFDLKMLQTAHDILSWENVIH